jgi:hypothetical protein
MIFLVFLHCEYITKRGLHVRLVFNLVKLGLFIITKGSNHFSLIANQFNLTH